MPVRTLQAYIHIWKQAVYMIESAFRFAEDCRVWVSVFALFDTHVPSILRSPVDRSIIISGVLRTAVASICTESLVQNEKCRWLAAFNRDMSQRHGLNESGLLFSSFPTPAT